MGIDLLTIHWIYLIFILLIIVFMICKKDTSLICILGIFVLGVVGTSDFSVAVMGVFNSFVFATEELMGTILIISVITGMSNILLISGINETMIYPFTKLIRTPSLAYWIIGILMMILSWFFWPSPAVALMGAVLLPIALKVGLPRIGVAMAMNLFGHGIALASDLIIQGAPKITADAAGIPVSDVVSASIPLNIVMGVVTTITAFYFLRKDMKNGTLFEEERAVEDIEDKDCIEKNKYKFSKGTRIFFAIVIPLFFAADIVIMYIKKLQGGDATALIGGTACFVLVMISVLTYREKGLEKITSHLIEGFQFGFKIFGAVIPIAAFFYLGDAAFGQIFGEVLPANSQGIVNDIGIALAKAVPINQGVAAVTLTTVGAITGLDGSGFSGISLAGSIAKLFSMALGSGIATLTALGQIAAIWVGGGTIVPWAVIPVAAICGIDAFELARRNMKPVLIGLIVTTIVGMFLI